MKREKDLEKRGGGVGERTRKKLRGDENRPWGPKGKKSFWGKRIQNERTAKKTERVAGRPLEGANIEPNRVNKNPLYKGKKEPTV